MKRREGFTLVELLIVVVIIGILVSISIPIFTAQMHKAEGGGRLGRISGHIMRKYRQIICLPSKRIRKLKRIGIQIPTMTGIR